jgi:excisionase family DNA binding protein
MTKRTKKPISAAARRAAAGTMLIEEMAGRLGIGRNQAYEAVKAGQIPALRIGRRWVIAEATVKRILAGELVTPVA